MLLSREVSCAISCPTPRITQREKEPRLNLASSSPTCGVGKQSTAAGALEDSSATSMLSKTSNYMGEYFTTGRTGKSEVLQEQLKTRFRNLPFHQKKNPLKDFSLRGCVAFLFFDFHSRVMVTGKGYVGRAHAQTLIEDKICLLQGCTMPMVETM